VRTELVLTERDSNPGGTCGGILPPDRQPLPDAATIGERIRRASQSATVLHLIDRIRDEAARTLNDERQRA